MRVGAAVPEAAHPREPRPVRPGGRLGDHVQPFGGEVDARVRGAEVQARRKDAVVHRQCGLDESEHTGRRFEMAEVRLRGADAQRRGPVGPEHGAERARLRHVAQGRARAVRLDVRHRRRCDPGVLPRRPQHLRLRLVAGGGQSVRRAVVVDGAAVHQRVDAVAVSERVGEPAQHDHRAALAPGVAVAVGVEGPAQAVGALCAEFRHGDRGVRMQHQVDAPGQGEVRLAGAQALHGEVHRDQGGAGRGRHAHRGAAQPQGVGDAGRDHRVVPADGRVGVDRLGGALREQRVLLPHRAHEDAGAGAREARRGTPRVLDGGARHLQGDPLLRVHLPCLGRWDGEVLRVEARDVVEESAPAVRRPAGCLRVGPVGGVPPVGGHLAHRVDAVEQRLPECGRVLDPGGQSAADADDRHRLVAAVRPGGGLVSHGWPRSRRARRAPGRSPRSRRAAPRR